jgi:hypothetical protein
MARLKEHSLRPGTRRSDTMIKEPPFTVGIEEEYLLADRASRDLIAAAPSAGRGS